MRDTRGETPRTQPDDDATGRLNAQLRRVQAAFVATGAPDDVLTRTAQLLAEAADALEPYRPAGLPGWGFRPVMDRTRALIPLLEDPHWERDRVTARVTFGRFYAGANNAVHGGAVPLLFDQVLGRLANNDRPMARTVNLTVDYRRVTPVGRPVRVEARFEREEGRKRLVTGALYDGEHLTVEARGLFVELRPGQS